MSDKKSDSIINIVRDIDNNNFFLPGIQRDLVWNKNKICKLFDSVLREYPIGEFILWKDKEPVRENQIIYEFIKHKSYNKNLDNDNVDFHIDDISPDYRNQELDDKSIKKLSENNENPRFVIDGQQRLSSFYIGLYGSITERTQNKLLYMDLLRYPQRDIDRDELKYMFEFKNKNEDIFYNSCRNGEKPELWIKLRCIPENIDDVSGSQGIKNIYENSEVRDKIKEDITFNNFAEYYSDNFKFEDNNAVYNKIYGSVILNNINKLYNSLTDGNIIRYTEMLTDETDTIMNLFVRTNVEAEMLDKEDIILAVMTNRWSQYNINAGEQIKSFKEELESEYNSGYQLDIDEIIKALAICTPNMSTSYDLSDFKGQNVQKAKEIWVKKDLQKAIKKSINTLQKIGFSGQVMNRYYSIQLPLTYFFYKNQDADISWDNGYENLRKIQFWVCLALIHGKKWSEAADSRIDDICEIIDNQDNNIFPLSEIRRKAKKSNWNATFKVDESDLKKSISDRSSVYRSGPAYAVMSLMYYPRQAKHSNYEMDHLHPKSKMKSGELQKINKLDQYEAESIADRKHSVTNHELLPPQVHKDKGDIELKDWLKNQNESYLDKHMIPHKNGRTYNNSDISMTNEQLWSRQNYMTFESLREQKIINNLLDKFNNMYKKEKYNELFEEV